MPSLQASYDLVFPASLTLANDILPPGIHMVSMAIMWVTYYCLMRFFENLSNQYSPASVSVGAGV